MPSYTKVANGNIRPMRFVKQDTTSGVKDRVLEGSAGARIYGISGAGVRNAPWSEIDDGYAAIAGENLQIWGFPEKDVLLELGTGGAAVGDLLKSDSDGTGIVTTTSGQEVGARCEQAGSAGDFVRVTLISPTQY